MAATALTVEDGTIVSGADSYITLVAAEQVVEDWNPPGRSTWDAAASTNDLKTAWLRLATRLLEDAAIWKGTLTDHETPQGRLWPRIGVFDREGRDVSESSIPEPIKIAQVFVAVAIGDSKIARRDTLRKLPKKEKLAALEVEYQAASASMNMGYSYNFQEVERLVVPDYAARMSLREGGGVSIGKITRGSARLDGGYWRG